MTFPPRKPGLSPQTQLQHRGRAVPPTPPPADADSFADSEPEHPLIAFWMLGAESLQFFPGLNGLTHKIPHGQQKEVINQMKTSRYAPQLSFTPSSANVSEVRRVAAEYTLQEIKEFVCEIQRCHSRFSHTQMCDLLTINDRSLRETMIWQAIQENWTISRTRGKCRVVNKPTSNVGRKPIVPRDPIEALSKLDADCLKSIRFLDEFAKQISTEMQTECHKYQQLTRAFIDKLKELLK